MKVLACLLLALFCFSAFAEEFANEFSHEMPKREEPRATILHYEPVLNFQVSEARDFLSFSAYNRMWRFNLELTDVQENNKDHFFGRISGDAKTLASWTLLPEYITGMILGANDTYFVEAREAEKPHELSMYRYSDIQYEGDSGKIKCHNTNKHERLTPIQDELHLDTDHQEDKKDKRTIRYAAVFADQYWLSGSYNPYYYSTGATVAIFNDVNALYAAAGLSTWRFDYYGGMSNPYGANPSALLTYLSNWQYYGNFNRGYNAIAWLVGLNVGGIAWLSSACGAYGPYYRGAISGLAYWNRIYTVKTLAHELGHNRGAPHDFANQCSTDSVANLATGCQCSVMSYCQNSRVNYFSTTSANQIRGVCP